MEDPRLVHSSFIQCDSFYCSELQQSISLTALTMLLTPKMNVSPISGATKHQQGTVLTEKERLCGSDLSFGDFLFHPNISMELKSLTTIWFFFKKLEYAVLNPRIVSNYLQESGSKTRQSLSHTDTFPWAWDLAQWQKQKARLSQYRKNNKPKTIWGQGRWAQWLRLRTGLEEDPVQFPAPITAPDSRSRESETFFRPQPHSRAHPHPSGLWRTCECN